QPRVARGTQRMLRINGTARRVSDARRQRGEDKGVKIRVPLQLRDDSLKLTGRGVKNGVNLGVNRVESFREGLPLLDACRVFEEVQVPAPVDCSGRDEALNLLIGGRVTLSGLDRVYDLRGVRVGNR